MPKNAVGAIEVTVDHQHKSYPSLGSIAFPVAVWPRRGICMKTSYAGDRFDVRQGAASAAPSGSAANERLIVQWLDIRKMTAREHLM